MEDYLEGGLDFAGRFGLERHAQQCYVCGKTLADAQSLSRISQNLGKVRAPENFEATVLARVHAADSNSWYRRLKFFGVDRAFLRPWALGAAGAALMALGALVVLDRGRMFMAPNPDRALRSADSISEEWISPPSGVVDFASTAAQEPRSIFGDLAHSSLPSRPMDVVTTPSASSARGPWTAGGMRASDSDYIEIPVTGLDGRQFMMRLPKTIRMRYGPPSEEHFIRNVSH